MKGASDKYKNQVGILQFNIKDDEKINDKEELVKILNKNINNYENYISKNIKPDTNELGYKKIIRILKEKYSIS